MQHGTVDPAARGARCRAGTSDASPMGMNQPDQAQPTSPVNPDPKAHPIHPNIPSQPIHEPLQTGEGTDPKQPITPGTMPGRALGSTTFHTVCHGVAPMEQLTSR